jgi:HlyD family secretion protein
MFSISKSLSLVLLFSGPAIAMEPKKEEAIKEILPFIIEQKNDALGTITLPNETEINALTDTIFITKKCDELKNDVEALKKQKEQLETSIKAKEEEQDKINSGAKARLLQKQAILKNIEAQLQEEEKNITKYSDLLAKSKVQRNQLLDDKTTCNTDISNIESRIKKDAEPKTSWFSWLK